MEVEENVTSSASSPGIQELLCVSLHDVSVRGLHEAHVPESDARADSVPEDDRKSAIEDPQDALVDRKGPENGGEDAQQIVPNRSWGFLGPEH